MSLILALLENARLRGGKLIARCPACAELGADKSGEHLFIADDGRFGCIANVGPSGKAHRQRIWELVGDTSTSAKPSLASLPCPKSIVRPSPQFPTLRPLTVTELAAIAHLRDWPSFAGLELLTQRGLLWHGKVFDGGREWPAWIITDSARRHAQARRIDGKPWQGIGGKKAKSLPGTEASWPIGASEIGERPVVLLCEGQPDFCAALLVAWWEELIVDRVAPVCMTGSGNPIHADALPLFAGKHVRIAIHDDVAGREAAKRWADQLHQAGAKIVDGFNFDGLHRHDGQPVNDLADFATLLDLDNPPSIGALSGLTSRIRR